MKKIKLFVFNVFIMACATVLIKGMGVWFNIFLASYLKEEGMGLFSLVMTVYSFAVTVATSGISLAVTRLVAEELTLNNHKGVKITMGKCFVFSLALSLASCFILYAFAEYITVNIFNSMLSIDFVHLLALCFPSISLSSVIGGYYNGVRKGSVTSLNQIGEQLCKIFVTYMLVKTDNPQSIEDVMVYVITGNIVGEYISLIVFLLLYIKSQKNYTNNRFSNGITKKLLHIAAPVALSSYIKSALTTLKNVIIPHAFEKGNLSGKQGMMVYGQINGMAMPVILFPSAITGAASALLVPEISACFIKKQYKRIIVIANEMYKLTMVYSLLVACILILYGEKIGMLFYESKTVGLYIVMLAPLSILMYLDTLTDCLLKGIDCQVSVVRINILDSLICIFLINYILPFWGGLGYIGILYISEIFNIVLSIRRLVKKLKFKINTFEIAVKPLICIGASVFFAGIFLKDNIYRLLAIILCYLIMLLLTKTIFNRKILISIIK